MTKVTICGNDEVLRGIWDDVFAAAEMNLGHWSDDLGNGWVQDFTGALSKDFGGRIDWDIETDFGYWNGGPGRGHWMMQVGSDVDEERIRAACKIADDSAREYAARLVSDHQEWILAEQEG